MTTELMELLRQAARRDLEWHDVVVTNNVAAIPPIDDTPGDFVWNRGFNMIVLDRWARPTHFAKCRAAQDAKLGHEAESLAALAQVPDLRQHLPEATNLRSDRLQVLLSQFLRGVPLNALVDRGFGRRVARIVRHALNAVTLLSARSTQALASRIPEQTFDLGAALERDVAYLVEAGLPQEDGAALRAAVHGVDPLPRQLQHGDLWPANIVARGHRLWFIDFEMFGEIQVPMYDVFHFLRTCSDAWDGSGASWFDRMRGGGTTHDLLKRSATEARGRLGLDTHQAVAALIYYVTHFSVTTHMRNPDGDVWKKFFMEVKSLAHHLQDGVDPALVFFES